MRCGTLRAVSDVSAEVKAHFEHFLQCHNDTVGHFGLHTTLRMLAQRGIEWTRMSRDVAAWIAECATCQKYRLGATEVRVAHSPIASFSVFEELSIDFVGPLPRDDVGNAYILNCVCMTTHYCELFAVEAATAVIAAHCLLKLLSKICVKENRKKYYHHTTPTNIEGSIYTSSS